MSRSNRTVQLPPQLEDIVETLRDTEGKLDQSLEKLAAKVSETSEFYSTEKLREQVQKLAAEAQVESDDKKLAEEMTRQRDFLKKEADDIENPFRLHNQSFEQVNFVKKMLIANMRAAAQEFFLKANDLLRESKNKKATAEALLTSSTVFTEFATFTYTDEEGFSFTLEKTITIDLADGFQMFGKNIKAFSEKKAKLANKYLRSDADKFFQMALDCVGKAFEAFEKEKPEQHKEKFVFVKKGESSSLQPSLVVMAEEKKMEKLREEGAVIIERLKPRDMSQARWTPDDEHYAKEKRLAKAAREKTRHLISVIDDAQDHLEKDSKTEHDNLEAEIKTYCEGVTNTSHEFEEATVALRQNMQDKEFSVRQGAYQRFQAVAEAANQIQTGRKRQVARHRLDRFQNKFGGKKTGVDRAAHEKRFDAVEKTYLAAMARADRFREESRADLADLEQEKLLKELVDLFTIVIFQNLEFWNKQLFMGQSNYQLDNVKVSNGLSVAGGILRNENLTDLQKVEGIKSAFEVRIAAGPKKFGFITVRADSTKELYAVSGLIRNLKQLTRKNVDDVKKAVARIQSNGVKLDLPPVVPASRSKTVEVLVEEEFSLQMGR
jgi:hypothetical protein